MFALENPIYSRQRISLAEIDAIVAARLGPGRVRGNGHPAAFSRQVAMYLANQVAGWSTTQIGKFYNGRDHSTVCYAIGRVRNLRRIDLSVNSILASLAEEIGAQGESNEPARSKSRDYGKAALSVLDQAVVEALADRIASRILTRLFCASPACTSGLPKRGSPDGPETEIR